MNILMHCHGIPFNGDTINTRSLGGSESAAYYMAKELAARGHKVTLFTNIQQEEEGSWDGVRYISNGDITDQAPLGEQFHFYSENTPNDVCIIQRHAQAFTRPVASKIRMLWLHDLALHRLTTQMNQQMVNVDTVLVVSEFHKKQVCEVFGFAPDSVIAITNGIDQSLFAGQMKKSKIPLVGMNHRKFITYSSRPERGLEHLVRPGGIMERLAKEAPEITLLFCGYDNVTPQMAPFYHQLWQWAARLPNCRNIGALTKKELADTFRSAWFHIYPTEFEEVSCITAMECMAAGLPMVASDAGALSETCQGAGVHLIPLKDGRADEDSFVKFMIEAAKGSIDRKKMVKDQESAANNYSWTKAADRLESAIEETFKRARGSTEATAKHMMRTSDIYALDRYIGDHQELNNTPIAAELAECYGFAFNNKFGEHYEAYYQYEKNRGVEYGPEILDGNNRFEHVSGLLRDLKPNSIVMDYGCAHGHYTVNLAKRYPQLRFIGVDIAQSNIDKARKWAADDGVKNVRFIRGAVDTELNDISGSWENGDPLADRIEADAIIAAEVLEHVAKPTETVKTLLRFMKPGGLFIGTTPYGPWEAQGYKQHHPWRAHLWHFEREDLRDIYGAQQGFEITVAPSGATAQGENLGSYIFTFKKSEAEFGAINYERKMKYLTPRQTLSVCMIAKDAELTIAKTLESVKSIADQIIVAIDETSKDSTEEIAKRYGAEVIKIKSPLEIGFDAARNISIATATGDWIMWIDSDEVLYNGEALHQILRNNQYKGYAIPQHHYSVFPAGIIKTDFPIRVFRNRVGIKFFGVVHEHPETDINKGVGHTTIIPQVVIGHYGYSTEDIRRGRFHRNIALLVRDRKTYPERQLGKFLWLRDLAQMCGWDAEKNGGQITQDMLERAKIGLKIWEELLDSNQLRMLIDGMDFYTTLAKIGHGGKGFDLAFKVDSSKLNGGTHLERQPEIKGFFASQEHAEKFITKLLKERTTVYESKYY